MDTHSTPRRPPASTSNHPSSAAVARGALLLLTVSALAGPSSAAAQGPPGPLHRPVDRRPLPWCNAEALDGVCDASCSGDPFDADFDADCFSCDQLAPPSPKPACAIPGEPCEIHEAINRLGSMVERGTYDDRVMREIVMAYWSSSAWDLSVNWGASALDGYVVYAMARTALEFKGDLDEHPTTRMAIECVLRDHAGRGVPVSASGSERRFHGAGNAWNTWSEDYMGFALGFAAADTWLRTSPTIEPYVDEYFGSVQEAVDRAFSVTESGGPATLTLEHDPDPANPDVGPSLMLRNHSENSPVYAIVIVKHVADINNLYRAAGLPPYFTCDSKPATFDALYHWVLGKIEANPIGAGFVFRSDGCERRDGVLSYCDDRPGDPPHSGGTRREPGHYPLARSLPDLCVAEGLEYFSATCDWLGPAGIRQAPHNYYFNCVFAEEIGAWSKSSRLQASTE